VAIARRAKNRCRPSRTATEPRNATVIENRV
jgi:hypothetical protein